MRRIVLCLLLLLASLAPPARAQLLGTAFTYQGTLKEAGAPATGAFDFQFALYPLAQNGAALSAPVSLASVPVEAGVFTVSLDFGDHYIGQPRWLEIRVRRAGAADFTLLAPRQALSPTPFALHAEFVADGSVVGASVQDRTLSGAKLALGSVTSAELADGSVTGPKIADGAVTSTRIANNAVNGNHINPGSIGRNQVNGDIQLRVANICPRGAPMIGIGADGSPICDQPLTVLPFSSSRVSVAVRPDGRPILARDGGNLWDCADANCTSGTSINVNLGGDVAMTLRSDGRAVIATGNNTQSLVICNDAACVSRTQRSLDAGSIGVFSGIALRADNTPLVSYFEFNSGQTRLYVCNDPTCASGTIRTITASPSYTPSGVRVRPNGTPVLALRNYFGGGHALYDCNDAGCSSGNVRGLGGGASLRFVLGLAVRTDNRPLVVNSGPVLHDCDDAACSVHTDRPFDTGEAVAGSAAVVRADGRPLLATISFFGAVKVFDCANVQCSAGTSQIVDQVDNGNFGDTEISMALRPDGRPVIGYVGSAGTVRLLMCVSTNCR
jgi:hypothetical protein